MPIFSVLIYKMIVKDLKTTFLEISYEKSLKNKLDFKDLMSKRKISIIISSILVFFNILILSIE